MRRRSCFSLDLPVTIVFLTADFVATAYAV